MLTFPPDLAFWVYFFNFSWFIGYDRKWRVECDRSLIGVVRYLVLYLILISDSLTVLLASLAHYFGLLDQNGECNTHITLRYWLFDPEMVIRIRVWFKNISLILSIWFISKIPKIFGCFLTCFLNDNFSSQNDSKEFIGRFYFNPTPSGSLL